jgi:hypothetical protein
LTALAIDKVDRLSRNELVRQLAESLGAEKAEAAVIDVATLAGLGALADYNRDQTLTLLERMAAVPGLVGIVARFAKVRIILRFR